jgi:hypothetical protein
VELTTNKKALPRRLATIQKIRREDGPLAAFKTFARSVPRLIYFKACFYLNEHRLDGSEIEADLARHRPRIDNADLHFVVIKSNQQADELEKSGFEFRSYPYVFNDAMTYSQMLDDGLIAFCTFVGKEFGAISWIVPSQQVQRKFEAPPVKVDYRNHEALRRAAWCNPKFRNLGIYRYTIENRNLYLWQKGYRILRSAEDYTNAAGIRLSKGVGDVTYGNAVLTRILGLGFWKETYNQNGSKRKT